MWLTLILTVLQVFGPILVSWLKSWFEEHAKNIAAGMPAVETYGSDLNAQRALLNAMYIALPRYAVFRRKLLRAMLEHPTGIPDEKMQDTLLVAKRALSE